MILKRFCPLTKVVVIFSSPSKVQGEMLMSHKRISLKISPWLTEASFYHFAPLVVSDLAWAVPLEALKSGSLLRLRVTVSTVETKN